MTAHPLSRRRAGMLCHVTSLPGASAHPTLDDALRFVDFLADAHIALWQVLPLNPPDEYGSPYRSRSLSAFATSLAADVDAEAAAHETRVFESDYAEFRATATHWLRDFVLYSALTEEHGEDWTQWPVALRTRDADALARYERAHSRTLGQLTAHQFVVSRRWGRIRRAANDRGIAVFGDAPLYPSHASADVWANQTLFALGARGELTEVAGVPPDYFAAEGQRWGNPVYAWPAHEASGFAWWITRVRRQLALFDVLRIDHFRGLAAYWSIPATAATATTGRWCPAPGRALLATLRDALGGLPLVAEDLGTITYDVHELRDDFALPGMRVLQFAFSGDPENPHLPSRYVPSSVAYTGTHDNDTTKGWFDSLPESARPSVSALFGTDRDPAARAIEIVLQSVANTAIVPMQDWLGLGSIARMNTPGQRDGNWQWRCPPDALTSSLAQRIREQVEAAGRG
jgi:4-alpha-glucanotransferase